VLRHRQGLRGLALRYVDRGDGEAGRLETCDHGLTVQAHDRRVADQRGAAAKAQLAQALSDGLKRAGRDDDPIRATAEIDVDDHRDFPGDSPRWGEPPAHSGYQVFRPTR
jgi:hypothetical protein